MAQGSDLVFYLISILTIIAAFSVILISNPIYSALLLAATMLGISAIYFTLEAYFIAGAQLIIYAGAVMVLFVMVVMLFNLREERQAFSKGSGSFILKMAAGGFLLGTLIKMIWSTAMVPTSGRVAVADGMDATKKIAIHLFSKYILAFEMIGLLLLVVLVGVIALARSKGGTHAKST